MNRSKMEMLFKEDDNQDIDKIETEVITVAMMMLVSVPAATLHGETNNNIPPIH